jgi:hypothetical protein
MPATVLCPGAMIRHGVWLYSRFSLSDRDVQALLFERGIDVIHGAIRPWSRPCEQAYAKQFTTLVLRKEGRVSFCGCSWKLRVAQWHRFYPTKGMRPSPSSGSA